MEAVKAVASIVQLVDAALGLAKKSTELYRSYREAPAFSKSVTNQRELLRSVLNDYTYLRPSLDFNNSKLDPLPLVNVATALSQVSGALQKLKAAHHCCEDGHTKNLSRIQWASIDKPAVKEAQEQLETSKSTLTNALLLLGIHFSALHQSTMETLVSNLQQHTGETSHTTRPLWQSEAQRTTVLQNNSAGADISTDTSFGRQPCLVIDRPENSPTKDLRDMKTYITLDPVAMSSRVSCVKTLQLLAPDHGISGCISSVSDCNKATYSLILRAKLPWWFGCRALILDWKLRRFINSWLNFTILPGYISLSRYVSKDSLIAQACSQGDEVIARKLFSEGISNPNDFISDWKWNGLFPCLEKVDKNIFSSELSDITILA
ncbi:hypothetical protein MMC14_010548, partial [Varicellaria rhodocarpa]|nr:hypothetical protein [Varicellaria rhodocarpa]